MLDLLAASYHNIGPLYDRAISLCFHQGTYLIKAPVGTGKSFLFFDGPIFSLYKHAPRPIRNRRSHQAYTQLLFVLERQIYLIQRSLTPTKAGGDSVKSMFYTVDLSPDEVEQRLSGYDTFFDESVVDVFADYLERVPFSNEKELDKQVSDLLPPKEVVLSAHFLMQDANNIFELAPGERLEIFKHIFGFIGIDHAKEKLREKRKEIQTTITVKGDMHDVQQRFSTTLDDMRSLIGTLEQEHISDTFIQEHIASLLGQSFFQDMRLLEGSIGMEGFVCEVDMTGGNEMLAYIQQQQERFTRLQAQQEEAKKYAQLVEQEKASLDKRLLQLTSEQERLEKELTTSDTSQFQHIEDTVAQQQKALQEKEKVHVDRCVEQGYEVSDFVGAVRVVDDIIAQGKQLQMQMTTIAKELQTLQQHHQDLQKRRGDLDQQLVSLGKSYDEQTVFRCDKIEGDCPYVELIKGSSLRALSQQQTSTQQQLDETKKSLTIVAKKREVQQKLLQELEQEKKAQGTLLLRLERKKLYEDYKEYQQMQKTYEQTLEKRASYQKQQLALAEQQKKLQDIQTQKQILTQELAKKQPSQEEYTTNLEKYTKELTTIDLPRLTALTASLEKLRESIHRLHDILAQYQQRYREIALLEQQQTQLKHLYTIFSKELLIIVLEDFLPIIQSTINSYLAEVAEYTLVFELEHTASDTVNLEIYVEDNKGKRAVKSLSGGQKSLLKLAWIFSIATMLQLPFLFLDETITSLDAVTTSHVADVLHRFVEQFTTKLYVITHSSQIQDMHIWDKEIEVQ